MGCEHLHHEEKLDEWNQCRSHIPTDDRQNGGDIHTNTGAEDEENEDESLVLSGMHDRLLQKSESTSTSESERDGDG